MLATTAAVTLVIVMMTQSHLLITGLLGHRLRRSGRRLRFGAFLLGSVLPDVPLILLTLGYVAWHRWGPALPAGERLFGASYDALYFGNPLWLLATSLFHAPLLIAALAWGGRRWRRPSLVWLAAGCGLHTLLDVFTHHDDGPLLLFPLDWHYRFRAPISYWHPQYGGALFSRLELLLDLAIATYLLAVAWVARRRRRAPAAAGTDGAG